MYRIKSTGEIKSQGDNDRKLKTAFYNHKATAKKRGIEFLFSYEEWQKWWIDSGKLQLRGKKVGCYQMCRKNDVGPYASWNVYCATITQNRRDYSLGKPLSKEVSQKVSKTMTGRKLSKTHIENITGKNNGYAKITITPLGMFETNNDAANAHNCSPSYISHMCKKKPDLFYHVYS